MRVFWNPQDPPRWSRQAALVLQVILAVRKAASGTASTGVAGLEAALEVTITKSIKYEIELANTKAFPLMQLVKGNGPCNAIVMTYSDGASHFCRPF